ncbi:hypothetical protein Adt_18522 [Abeliophyllum distichum]|uniref:Uncharacterized protein n=1 Tax=Abeliophyllum distichum TaxID=126358 RepID=A0ABD1TJL1_9LAMI
MGISCGRLQLILEELLEVEQSRTEHGLVFSFFPQSHGLWKMPRGKGRLEWLGKTWGRDENGDFLWKITELILEELLEVQQSRTDRAFRLVFSFFSQSDGFWKISRTNAARERKFTRVLLYFPKINGMRIYMP